MVKFVGFSKGESGICTQLFVPSKLKAPPTIPATPAVAVPTRVPLLVPAPSAALTSPGHQLTMPAGGEKQLAPRDWLAAESSRLAASTACLRRKLRLRDLDWSFT